MDIYLEDGAGYEAVVEALKRCEQDDILCCADEEQFSLARSAITKEKFAGITVQLLDADGYVVRQITSRKRESVSEGRLTDKQIAVIKALEKVLSYCKAEGVQLIGYSDELVALPVGLDDEEIASAVAISLETQGVYRGVEALDDHY